jgi:hypothetical protein
MALSILDGNQSATTLSTIVTSGQHIPAHTVVSLGTQAISNITSAVSGTSVTFGLVGVTVTANNFTLTNVLQYDGSHYFLKVGGVATTGGTSFPVYVAGSVTANPTGTQTIAGTVTANNLSKDIYDASNTSYLTRVALHRSLGSGEWQEVGGNGGLENPLPISGTVTIGSALPTGTNRIGVVTIGGGTVTIGAGTAQIGSVTASISGTVPISISSVTVGNSVTIGSLPAISGTVTANGIASNEGELVPDKAVWMAYNNDNALQGVGNSTPLPISGTVAANTFALQGTAVTTSNFTSTTASTVLANYNATREVLTIFNEGAGNLHICAGATCTTIAYQVRLSAGDYYEVPNHQTTITHSAVFATAGTARVCQVS